MVESVYVSVIKRKFFKLFCSDQFQFIGGEHYRCFCVSNFFKNVMSRVPDPSWVLIIKA